MLFTSTVVYLCWDLPRNTPRVAGHDNNNRPVACLDNWPIARVTITRKICCETQWTHYSHITSYATCSCLSIFAVDFVIFFEKGIHGTRHKDTLFIEVMCTLLPFVVCCIVVNHLGKLFLGGSVHRLTVESTSANWWRLVCRTRE